MTQRQDPGGDAGRGRQAANDAGSAPPEKQRSWFARHKVLTTILALLAFFALGSMLGGGDDGAPSEASSPAAVATDAPADVEEPATDEAAEEDPQA